MALDARVAPPRERGGPPRQLVALLLHLAGSKPSRQVRHLPLVLEPRLVQRDGFGRGEAFELGARRVRHRDERVHRVREGRLELRLRRTRRGLHVALEPVDVVEPRGELGGDRGPRRAHVRLLEGEKRGEPRVVEGIRIRRGRVDGALLRGAGAGRVARVGVLAVLRGRGGEAGQVRVRRGGFATPRRRGEPVSESRDAQLDGVFEDALRDVVALGAPRRDGGLVPLRAASLHDRDALESAQDAASARPGVAQRANLRGAVAERGALKRRVIARAQRRLAKHERGLRGVRHARLREARQELVLRVDEDVVLDAAAHVDVPPAALNRLVPGHGDATRREEKARSKDRAGTEPGPSRALARSRREGRRGCLARSTRRRTSPARRRREPLARPRETAREGARGREPSSGEAARWMKRKVSFWAVETMGFVAAQVVARAGLDFIAIFPARPAGYRRHICARRLPLASCSGALARHGGEAPLARARRGVGRGRSLSARGPELPHRGGRPHRLLPGPRRAPDVPPHRRARREIGGEESVPQARPRALCLPRASPRRTPRRPNRAVCRAAGASTSCASGVTSHPGPAFVRANLSALDDALGGGVPTGSISELVGPAGAGKTQMCLTLAAAVAAPKESGGLGAGVVYVDTEQKFSGVRLAEIAAAKFPETFGAGVADAAAREAAVEALTSRVLVLTPSTLSEMLQRLNGLEEALIDHGVRLLVVDSMAALARAEFGRGQLARRQELLGQIASVLKQHAERLHMAAFVTNQVTTRLGGAGTRHATGGEEASGANLEARRCGRRRRRGGEGSMTAALAPRAYCGTRARREGAAAARRGGRSGRRGGRGGEVAVRARAPRPRGCFRLGAC